MPELDRQIRSNRRRSWLLFLGFFAIYALLGIGVSYYAGGWPASDNLLFLAIFFVVAGLIVLFTLFLGDDMAVMLAKAKKVESRDQAPKLWDAVENMALASGQQMPRLYISPDPSPNAFAAGRSKRQALLCVNQGLLELLDKEELEGVIAHEMAHIRNMDVRLMTYAAVLAGGIALICEALTYMIWFSGDDDDSGGNIIGLVIIILAAILAPIAAALIHMSISRQREFLADASAAELTKYPQGLASALRQLQANRIPATTGASATAHLCIVAPLNKKDKESKLFSTHPPLDERIAKLDELAAGQIHSRRPVVGLTDENPGT